MNRRLISKLAFFSLAFAAISQSSFAGIPNTTAAGAVPYEVGQGWVTHYFDETTPNRWFNFAEYGGRSYCIEAVQGPVSPVALDPVVTAYADATGTTVLVADSAAVTNNNGGGDPGYVKGSRACYIAPTAINLTTVRAIKLNVPLMASSGDVGYVRLRVVDTTLVATSCSLVGSGFPPVAHLSNAAAVATSVSLSFPSASVTVKQAYTVPANGSLSQVFPNATSAITTSGPCFVAHNGPPGSLMGRVQSPSSSEYFQLNSR